MSENAYFNHGLGYIYPIIRAYTMHGTSCNGNGVIEKCARVWNYLEYVATWVVRYHVKYVLVIAPPINERELRVSHDPMRHGNSRETTSPSRSKLTHYYNRLRRGGGREGERDEREEGEEREWERKEERLLINT